MHKFSAVLLFVLVSVAVILAAPAGDDGKEFVAKPCNRGVTTTTTVAPGRKRREAVEEVEGEVSEGESEDGYEDDSEEDGEEEEEEEEVEEGDEEHESHATGKEEPAAKPCNRGARTTITTTTTTTPAPVGK